MKKLIIMFTFLMTSIFAFANGDAVLGKWITEKAKNGNQIIVEIYKTADNKYNGRVVELTMPVYTEGEFVGQEKMDLKNPDDSLKHRKLRGIDFVYGFTYSQEDKKYEDGYIYVPPLGKTLYSYMKLQKDGTLLVKGSFDKSGLIGKKQIWHRY